MIVSLRVSRQEAEWIDHFAAAENRSRANWLYSVVAGRLIELATTRKEAPAKR